MARIRAVHPKLWTDEAFVSVSPYARLLAIGLWNESDDGGAFEWKPRQIKMRLFAGDNTDMPALLAELVAANMIGRYTVDGRDYGAVRNFGKFQRPKSPRRQHPMPHEWRIYAATAADDDENGGADGGGSSPSTPPSEGQISPPTPRPSENQAPHPGEFPHPSEIAAPHPGEFPHSFRNRRAEDLGNRVKVVGGKKEPPYPPLTRGAARDGDPPEFVAFWNEYPRKDDKGHARRAFTAALRRASAGEILLGLRRYQFSAEPRFRPLAATWLNGERWRNEPNSEPPSTAPPASKSQGNHDYLLRLAGFPTSETAS